MMAVIKKSHQDGVIMYKVLKAGDKGQQVEFNSKDAGACEKYCENYYGTDWGWV